MSLAVMALAACSDHDSDSTGKQKPDASALDAGDRHAHDAGRKSDNAGRSRDAATGDASTTPMHPHMDGGMAADATAPHPGHDSGSASDDDGGALGCDATLASSIELVTQRSSVLLLFDRSFSMADDWNGSPRWQTAGHAVIAALTPLQDVLDLGVILYPSVTPSSSDALGACGVDAFDSTEQLAFQPAEMALQKLKAAAPAGSPKPMYAPIGSNLGTSQNEPIGATPTLEAIDQANAALASATFSGPALVVLVTDGEPNCTWDQSSATDRVAGWRSAFDIDTHVMLLSVPPSGGGPNTAVPVGEALAAAGGTTLVQAEDATNLQDALSTAVSHSLVQRVKSCSIVMDPPAARPDAVQLVVTEHAIGERKAAAHDLGKGSGWTISTDGVNVKLTGALCDDAKRGRFDSLALSYGCESLAPLETEPPSCANAGSTYCHGACIDVASDENNCGGCDQRCGGGLTCCAGRCLDTTYDKNNCGTCGRICDQCCGGECKANDADNCHACGMVCDGDTPCCCKDGCHAMPQVGTCDPSC